MSELPPKRPDPEVILAERKRKTAVANLSPIIDAMMLHYVMNVLYTELLKEHGLRADWQPNLILSSKKYVAKLPAYQVVQVADLATQRAQECFGPVLGSLEGVDVRYVLIAYAQMILTLVDQHRYRFTDDALVLQAMGIVHEAVEDQTEDWGYLRQPVRHFYQDLMKRVDRSVHFKVETEHDGVAYDVLR